MTEQQRRSKGQTWDYAQMDMDMSKDEAIIKHWNKNQLGDSW
jgi:hypothetical protein